MTTILENGELEASEIATAGIVEDEYGNRWTLPTSDLGEEVDFNYNPIDLPKRDPRFHYQFERTDRLGWAISEGFVPVRRSEVGLNMLNDSSKKLSDYGINTNTDEDPVHTVHDLTLVKIPSQLAERRRARAKLEADKAKASIEPPARLDGAKSRLKSEWERLGQKIEENVVHTEERVVPRNRQ